MTTAELLLDRAVRAVAERRYCEEFGLDSLPPELAEHFNRSAIRANIVKDVETALATIAASNLIEALEGARREIVFMLKGNEALAKSNLSVMRIDAALAEAKGQPTA